MPSEVVGEQLRRQPATTAAKGQPAAAAEQEHLPCPRCDSMNTKFCYYNNYNFSQPRHFCKACRRYWTHGGTLRDIPVGGGSRKNAKRSRTAPASAAAAAAASLPLSATPVLLPLSGGGGGGGGSFTSLLNTQGPGFLALGGFGLGLGGGLEDLGFGLGRGIWPFGGEGAGGNGGGARGMGATWQFEGGDHHNHHHHHHGHVGGLVGGAVGDYCSWAEPAISTPGSALK